MAVTQGLSKDMRRFIPGMPLHVDNVSLTGAGAAKTVTVPMGASFCVFSPYPKTADFLVCRSTTATRPVLDVTDGSASMANPTVLAVTPGGTFSAIAGADNVNVTLSYFDNASVTS